MKLKAQFSLQMTIGILILFVVAIVVLRLIASKINSSSIQLSSDTNKNLDFESLCNGFCADYKNSGKIEYLAKFCSVKMAQTDLNKNGKIDSIKATTKILDICEDAVYCFHLYPCDIGSKTLEWADCRKAVCDYYTETYSGDSNKADMKVFELFPRVGSCEIPKEENWWEMYFGKKPCTDPPVGLYLDSCIYDPINYEMICETNCRFEQGKSLVFSVTDGTNIAVAKIKPDGSFDPPGSSINFIDRKIKVKTEPSLSTLQITSPDSLRIALFCNSPFGNVGLIGISITGVSGP